MKESVAHHVREERVAKLIANLGKTANLVFSAVKENPKTGLSSVRYGLIEPGTTVASQIQRVYDHYAKMGNMELALKEAGKVRADLAHDMAPYRSFYTLVHKTR